MSKRKILTLALSLCMVAILAVGGTLAYFTDTDSANNVFTVGNVKIDLIEKQRNSAGTALENFAFNKKLNPIVGSAQDDKDAFGLPTAGNYVDKIVTVKVENGSENAYVRVYYAIPTVLDNVGNASQNIVHVNDGNKFVAAGNKTDVNAINADYTAYMGKEVSLVTNFPITVTGADNTAHNIAYNIYYRDYNKVMAANEETGAAFITGLYLDKDVDYKGTSYTINGQTINYNFSWGVVIPVVAVGVQAAGFNSCADAVNAAFGANYNPWDTAN